MHVPTHGCARAKRREGVGARIRIGISGVCNHAAVASTRYVHLDVIDKGQGISVVVRLIGLGDGCVQWQVLNDVENRSFCLRNNKKLGPLSSLVNCAKS